MSYLLNSRLSATSIFLPSSQQRRQQLQATQPRQFWRPAPFSFSCFTNWIEVSSQICTDESEDLNKLRLHNSGNQQGAKLIKWKIYVPYRTSQTKGTTHLTEWRQVNNWNQARGYWGQWAILFQLECYLPISPLLSMDRSVSSVSNPSSVGMLPDSSL